MKILVTGGAGFIGTNYVYHAVKLGYEVVVLDKLTYAGGKDNLDPLMHIPGMCKLVVGDICDRKVYKEVFAEKIDWVVHFAAESHVTRSEHNPDIFYQTNVEGTKIMLDESIKIGIKKFLHISCYDEITRAFTKNGLKTYKELNINDEVLTINPDTKTIEWQYIKKIIIQNYSGEMVKIKNKRIDLLITPNHRFLVETSKNKNIKIIEAREMLKRATSKVPAGKWLPKNTDKHSLDFYYILGFFIGDGFLAYQEKMQQNKTGLNRKEWLSRARNKQTGIWQEVGHIGIRQTTTMHAYRIFIDVPNNDKSRKKVEEALTRLGYKWTAQKAKAGEHIYLTSKDLYKYFIDCGKGAKNKRIPRWALEASSEALQQTLDGLIDSDGSHRKNGAVISTSSKGLSEDIAELCAKLSYSSAVKSYHNISYINGRKIEGDGIIVSISKTQRNIIRSRVKSMSYNGKIWCVNTPPNRNLLVERNGKFIFCGNTDEVYGSKDSGYFKETDKIKGDSQASSAYAKSKSLADDLALEYGKKYPIIVTRTTNNFGPWQFPEKALPRWITNLLLRKKIPLWGEGKQVRDWLFAPENAKAIQFVLENGKLGEVYNVAANNTPEITNIDAAKMVCELMDLDPREWIELIPDPRPDHDFRYAIDTTKIEKLGWKPERNLQKQFGETIKWYKENRRWWEKRKEEAERIYNG